MNEKISYDSICKELFGELSDESIVKFINSQFGRNYPLDSKVDNPKTDSILDGTENRSDIIIGIGNDLYLINTYHVELQTSEDSGMAKRVFEYAYRAALDKCKCTKDSLELTFPRSAVFYQRSEKTTPEEFLIRLNLPDDTVKVYKVSAKKVSDFSSQDLTDREKGLYAFVPNYPLNFEDKTNEEALAELKNGNELITDNLVVMVKDGEVSQRFAELAVKGLTDITENVLLKNGKTREEVDEFMEATVKRFALEPLNWEARGLAKGIAKTASKMFMRGDTIEDVQEVTDLDRVTLQKLQETVAAEMRTKHGE
jgi:hypothetical protein